RGLSVRRSSGSRCCPAALTTPGIESKVRSALCRSSPSTGSLTGRARTVLLSATRRCDRVKVVVNARNGARDFECEPGEKILHAGLRSGVELPYECATGTCGTCKARLLSGRAESQWSEAPGRRYFKSEADLLLCQSVARADCALEVGGMLKPREPGATAPRALGGVVRACRRLTHDVVAVDLDIDEPLDFDAGQFALVSVPGIAGARAYSMVNFDRRAERLSFDVKEKPGGAVSNWLFGDGVNGISLGLVAPLGHATFHPDVRKHVLCFARGFVHAVAGERMAGRFADVRAYVAGPPPMVDASLRLLLREARLPPADIRYDKFS